jgi:hypothetical protein
VGADDSIHSVLAEAQSWAEAHRDLLQRTFERFDETGVWPQLEELQHDFTIGGRDDVDVATLAYAMPPSLGSVQQGRLVLLTRGLSYVESAAWLLDIWAASLRIACQRWIHDHKTAWLTRKDVEELTHGNRHQTDRVSEVLLRERWAFGDGHGISTENWEQKAIDAVRIARSTRDARTLLEKRAEIEFPKSSVSQMPAVPDPGPSAPSTDASAERLGSATHETKVFPDRRKEWLRRFFGNPYAVVIIGGIGVLAIWAILTDGFSEVIDGDGGNSKVRTDTGSAGKQGGGGGEANAGQAAQRFKETAGEGGATTYANPHTLSEPGEPVEPSQKVKVICRVYAPEPPSVNPDGYWYRLASSPWNGQYYAPANSFWNGDIPGNRPYTHNTDKHVPICKPGSR